MLTKQQKIILVAAGILVIIIVAVGLIFQSQEKNKQEKEKLASQKAAPTSTAVVEAPKFTLEVPKDAVETPPQQAIPLVAGNGESKQSIFTITASADGYNPSSFNVKAGDIITIRFSAQGGDYDWYIPGYGFEIQAKAGETKESSFQPTTAGTFVVECRNACPPNKKITGQLIILP